MFLCSLGVGLVLVGEGENAQIRGWSVMTFSARDSAEAPISLLGCSFPPEQGGLFQGLVLKARYNAVMLDECEQLGLLQLQVQTDDHRRLCRGGLLGYPFISSGTFLPYPGTEFTVVHNCKA